MADSILILFTLTIVGWQGGYCQTVPPVDNKVVCREHVLNQCKSLNYNTSFPNLRGQTLPSVIEEEFLQYEILFRYNCSNALLVLLCGVYAPFCGSNTPDKTGLVQKPCQNLCTHVYNGCIAIFNEFQYQWPEILNCKNFPNGSEELCFGHDPLNIEYPTLVSPNATIPLPTHASEAPTPLTEAPTSLQGNVNS